MGENRDFHLKLYLMDKQIITWNKKKPHEMSVVPHYFFEYRFEHS